MEIATVLDQPRLAEDIAHHLSAPERPCAVIEGPSSSGKTALADAVADRLRSKFALRYARGDRLDRGVNEHPLEVRLLQPTRRDVAEVVVDVADDLADLLTDDGVPFGKLLNRALTRVLVGGGRRAG